MLSPIFKLLTKRLRKGQVSLNELARIVAAKVKKGYSQVGNELLHGAGSSWIV